MRIAATILTLLLLPGIPPAALALEPSAMVTTATILKTTTSWDGKPLAYPSGQAEITGMVIEIMPGGETGWHLHPVPSFGMMLDGELEVRQKNGATKRLRKGDALAEVVNTLHNGRNVGGSPVRIVVFYAGATNLPLTVKHAPRPADRVAPAAETAQ
jgi:quercetin dioxygenase-like cupin family protein